MTENVIGLLLTLMLSPQDKSSPTFVPRPDYIYYRKLPQRPSDARSIHLTIGVFDNFAALTNPTEMLLTLRDPKTGALMRFLLAESTTLDGKALSCPQTRRSGDLQLCAAFPTSMVPGVTRLAVLYWAEPFPDDTASGTDTLVTLDDR